MNRGNRKNRLIESFDSIDRHYGRRTGLWGIGGASGSALKIRNRVDAAGGVVLNCRAWRENFGYLARPFKAHYLAEPDTEELVRRVTLAEATR